MRPVLGFGEYLQAGKVSGARSGELQNKMIRAAQELERQLDALADYTKLCMRKPRWQQVDLSSLLRAVVEQELAKVCLGEECVELTEGIPPVLGDLEMLKLVYQELIGNALAFKQADQPPRVKISGHQTGDRIETTIQDSGLGIPAHCLSLLGKPFQRFHCEGHLAVGIGLGLARVGRSLGVLNGRLHCLSQPGEGTLFVVSLRAA